MSQVGWARNLRRVYRDLDKPDLVMGVSVPLWIAWPLVAARRRWRIPAILEVRDLWPEAIVNMGIAPAYHPAVLGIGMLERWAYRNVDHIVTIFDGQKENIAGRRLKRADQIDVIPHGVMLDAYEQVPAAARGEIRGQLGIAADQRVVIYAGSHGPIYNLTTLIDAAEHLRDRSDIQFISIGDGWERQKLVNEVQRRGLTNIRFLGPVPACEVPAYLSAADIACSVVNARALTGWNDRTRGAFRNAMFDYAAARLPVVFNDPGCAVHEVQERANGGLYADTANGVEEMVRHIARLADNPDEAREMGENNYRGIALKYNRRKMAKVYVELMERMVNRAAEPVTAQLRS
jgi:glycosyltransferase involved in cell wall biosynthesis